VLGGDGRGDVVEDATLDDPVYWRAVDHEPS
jgi:hypothetical protein